MRYYFFMQFKKNLPLIILLLTCSIIALLAIILLRPSHPTTTVNAQSVATSTDPQYFSELDGSAVDNAVLESPQTVGVMVDNHPDARPQSGLSKAEVVYEAPVEGSYTRYLAIYNANDAVSQIGPVRSARPYFLDWLREYGDTLYMHCGGSPEALDLIQAQDIFDANEFYWGRFYWRNEDKTAPHNLFTKSDLWNSLLTNYGASRTTTEWKGWQFAENNISVSTSTEPVKEIKIPFSADNQVVWKYNANAGNYERWLNGAQVLDSDKTPITAKNVLVQYILVKVIDDDGRLKLSTVGSGDAKILINGEMIRGKWEKDSATARTTFYDQNNQEVMLAPGHTWVEVVPNNTVLEVTN